MEVDRSELEAVASALALVRRFLERHDEIAAQMRMEEARLSPLTLEVAKACGRVMEMLGQAAGDETPAAARPRPLASKAERPPPGAVPCVVCHRMVIETWGGRCATCRVKDEPMLGDCQSPAAETLRAEPPRSRFDRFLNETDVASLSRGSIIDALRCAFEAGGRA